MRLAFDLWSLDDVSAHADAILERLEAGTMPCDGAWPAERVAVFRRWIDAGKPASGRRFDPYPAHCEHERERAEQLRSRSQDAGAYLQMA